MIPKIKLLIKTRNGYSASEEELTKLIADYFKRRFWKNRPFLPDIQPSKMKLEFTKEEVERAIKHLKYNKSAGRDHVKAELIKYGTEDIYILQL